MGRSSQQRASQIHNTRAQIWEREREEAFQHGWRRPWDGQNGRAYLKWKREKQRKIDADRLLERALAKVHDSDEESASSSGSESVNSQASAVKEKRRAEHLAAIQEALKESADNWEFASESEKSAAEAESSDDSEDV